MKNKSLIIMFIIALIGSILFLGASITGLIVYKVEYNDLCRTDEDCFGKECCLIYEDKDVGVCMEHCQSFEFLCRTDKECEEGTVCCLSKGKEYGICNYPEKCLDVDIFAEYIGRVSFLEPRTISPAVERPFEFDSDKLVIYETIFIIALFVFIIWLLAKKEKKK